MNEIVEPSYLDVVSPANPNTLATVRLDEANTLIKSLLKSRANYFDPVRFRFIESMAERSVEQNDPISDILEEKVLKALTDYQTDLSRGQAELLATLQQTLVKFPDSATELQQLYDDYQFTTLKSLSAKLERQHKQHNNHSQALVTLTEQMNQEESVSDKPAYNDSQRRSLAELVQRQEDDALLSLSDVKAKAELVTDACKTAATDQNAPRELKSIKLFRESWAKLNSDQLVTRIIKEGPENPGPLNPEMLVIRSLATMRDLSPDYLNRFVSYIDTLLWLDDAVKSSGAKQSKKRKRKTRMKT